MSSGENRRVMIVDDDDDIIESYSALLRGEGFEVAPARHGKEALERLRAEPPPSLILLDLMMPVMNGWELCAELRADPSLATIPVVIFSGDHRSLTRSAPEGIAAVLRKPVDVDDLLRAIDRCARAA